MKRIHTRIGFYMYAPILGGAERYLRDLVWGVPRDEFEVFVIYPPWAGFEDFLGMRQAPTLHAIPVRTAEPSRRREPNEGPTPATLALINCQAALPANLKQSAYRYGRYGVWAWNYPLLRRTFGRLQLDILHVVNGGYPGASSAQAAVVAAQRAGVRARIMTVASTPMARWFPTFVEAAIDHAVADAVDAFIVPSAGMSHVLTDRRGMPPDLCWEIPWGPHASTGEPATRDRRDRVRASLGLPAHAPLVIIVANLLPTKGHLTLVDALAKLRGDGVDARALIVGDGPARPNIERRIAEAGLRDAVVFAGRLPEPSAAHTARPHLYDALQAADAFVLPSEIEGLPYSVLEAMSQGLPVIATNVGAIPEAVVHGETGWIIEPNDVDGLATALRQTLSDLPRAAAMGDAGRRRYLDRFSRDAMIHRTVDLYRALLERAESHRGPARRTTARP